ncbi:MAG: hypothetical protein II737_09640 [Mailhella sp.]|nr:hypothetical protein [Mailhella sp.]
MRSLAFAAALFFLFQSPSFAAPLDVDDFLPPVQARDGSAKQDALAIRQPQSVKTEKGLDGKPAVSAPSAQDAINAAIREIPAGDGCEQIRFPSGFGWVSSGTSIYKAMPNKVASLTAQRLAYQKAHLQARNNLARTLYGLSTDGKTQMSSELATITTDTDTMANTNDTAGEAITEKVNGMLRGYVLYDLKDEQKDGHGIVTVTIVATPRTMNAATRVDSSAISAGSVREGVRQVLTELSSGLLPPVGGKTILAKTGELAYVGFGSAIVKENPDPALSARLSLDAQKMAAMRARSALCGIIIGDEISSASKLDAATSQLSTQFEKEEKNGLFFWRDKDEGRIRKLEEQKTAFLSSETFKEEISSVRRGVLPPGVTVKTFFNDEKSIVTGVAVYMPSASMGADQFRKAMGASRILQPLDRAPQAGGGKGLPQMPGQGPTGRVQQDAEL